MTLLHSAAGLGSLPIVRLLVSAGADSTAIDDRSYTTLHSVTWCFEESRQGDLLAIASLFLDKGVDPNARDCNGSTALHQAVLMAKYDLMQLLLDSGADVNAVGKDGGTPLHCLASSCFTFPDETLPADQEADLRNAARILLQYHADINVKNAGGLTPMRVAADHGLCGLAEFLRQNCAMI